MNRNNGLMVKSMEMEENRISINLLKQINGTEQIGIDNAWKNG